LEKRYDPTLDGENGDGAHYEMTIERVEQLAEEMIALGQPAPDDIVQYCERGAGLCQEPVDVAGFCPPSRWEGLRSRGLINLRLNEALCTKSRPMLHFVEKARSRTPRHRYYAGALTETLPYETSLKR
jgi:hypothetical protein